MTKQQRKQTMIAGALTGTAGIFLTKLMGLVYVIPFQAMAGSQTVFYSYAFTIYDYCLQICLGGFPFALATLVAKYMAKDDHATVMVIRRIASLVMGIFGVISCGALIMFSRTAAGMIIPDTVPASEYSYYIATTQTVLIIVAFALLFVPILSFYRGFYQGMRDMRVYARTQVLEQLIRVAFLLGAGALCYYVLDMDQIWTVYMAVASTSIAAVGSIIYFIFYDRRHIGEVTASMPADRRPLSGKAVFKELMAYAIPYFIAAIITNSSSMFVLLMFASGMQAYGTDGVQITVLQGLIDYQSAKLTMIPQIFASGFALALVPHITTALTLGDEKGARDLVTKALDMVNYLAVPVVAFMAVFAREIFYVMYGAYHLDDGASILSKALLLMLLLIFVTVLQSILLSMRMQKAYVIIDTVELAFILLTFHYFLAHLGVNGYFLVYAVKYLIFIAASLYLIVGRTNLRLRPLAERFGQAWVGCLPMLLLAAALDWGHYDVTSGSRLVTLAVIAVLGLITMAGYLLITGRFGLPQYLFGIELTPAGIKGLINRIIHPSQQDETGVENPSDSE